MLSLIECSQKVIGNLGWVDHSGVWEYDLETQTSRLVPTGSAKFVTLRRYDDLLRIIHHETDVPAITLRSISDLETDLARLEVRADCGTFSGDVVLWSRVDPCALLPTGQQTELIHIDPASKRVRTLDLSWYRDGAYDLGYQGLVDSLTLPDRQHVVVSVQRSSTLVVLDMARNEKEAELELACRGGNPILSLHFDGRLVTVDYDTICLVDLGALNVIAKARLQEDGFVGDANLGPDGLVVARPFSGDILLLNIDTLEVEGRAVTGFQPLQAVQISGSEVLARDWKTGAVLRGMIER